MEELIRELAAIRKELEAMREVLEVLAIVQVSHDIDATTEINKIKKHIHDKGTKYVRGENQ